MRCQLLSIISITDLQPGHGGLQNYPGSLPHWGKFAGSRSRLPRSVKKKAPSLCRHTLASNGGW